MHQDLANSIFRIECGTSSGTGFSFIKDTIIVTNHHVIESKITEGVSIYAITECGKILRTKLLTYSDKSKYDFAILELTDLLPEGRTILHPQSNISITRGEKTLFGGFPHGIHDLLIHEAIISGYVEKHAFYLDGSVNGGNSGGPIINNKGELIGIITQRRFLGGHSLQKLGQQVSILALQCNNIANRGSANIMGIDFGQFAGLVAQGLSALSQVIESNANVGIGIGFKIQYVNDAYNKLKN